MCDVETMDDAHKMSIAWLYFLQLKVTKASQSSQGMFWIYIFVLLPMLALSSRLFK
jgi:hypothetical protein